MADFNIKWYAGRVKAAFLITLFLVGAGAARADSGYVVKIESGSVYLDLGEKAGAVSGETFQIYTEGEELKHPVTGQSLGRIEKPVAEGRVTLALPLYSVGRLLADQPADAVKPGMRARLQPQPAAGLIPAGQAGQNPAAREREPRWKSPPLPYAVVGMAAADFRGDGTTTLALADKNTVSLYDYPPKLGQPLAQYVVPGVGPRILSLAAGDVDGDKRSELFVTIYNETFDRVETEILQWSDGRWTQAGELPWMVRSFQDGSGRPVLAMQQLIADETFPFSKIYRLAFADGKYAPGEALPLKRVEFLYDFTQASLQPGKPPALLYQTPTDRLRAQFQDGFWKTEDAYGQTPTRLRWHGRLLEFHPQIPVSYQEGKASVFLIRNLAALGGLSEPFGVFSGARIERHDWNGIALAPTWRAELGGYCTAAALIPAADKPADLAVAVTSTAGTSAVWIFDP